MGKVTVVAETASAALLVMSAHACLVLLDVIALVLVILLAVASLRMATSTS